MPVYRVVLLAVTGSVAAATNFFLNDRWDRGSLSLAHCHESEKSDHLVSLSTSHRSGDHPFSGSIVDCARFIDDQKGQWEVLQKDLPNGPRAGANTKNWGGRMFRSKEGESYDVDPNSGARVDCLQMKCGYQARALEDGKHSQAQPTSSSAIPVYRIIGFFPGTSPKEVHDNTVDLNLRPKWDHNYRLYKKCMIPGASDPHLQQASIRGLEGMLGGLSPSAASAADGPEWDRFQDLQRKWSRVAKKHIVCTEGGCILRTNICSIIEEHGWFAHRAGHTLLKKFGVSGRFFGYERQSVRHELIDPVTNQSLVPANSGMCMYDVLYHSPRIMALPDHMPLKPSQENASSSSLRERIDNWFVSLLEPNEHKVFMHYQAIHLIPIVNAHEQLWHHDMAHDAESNIVDELRFSGSILDEHATRICYHLLQDSTQRYLQQLEQKQQPSEALTTVSRKHSAVAPGFEHGGTLMVVTSANDAKIPSSMPHWAQRTFMPVFSKQAYGHLLEGIRKNRAEAIPENDEESLSP